MQWNVVLPVVKLHLVAPCVSAIPLCLLFGNTIEHINETSRRPRLLTDCIGKHSYSQNNLQVTFCKRYQWSIWTQPVRRPRIRTWRPRPQKIGDVLCLCSVRNLLSTVLETGLLHSAVSDCHPFMYVSCEYSPLCSLTPSRAHTHILTWTLQHFLISTRRIPP